MAYAAPFHRLVIIGKLYDDIFNMTLSMIPVGGATLPAVTDSLLLSTLQGVQTWWPKVPQASMGGGCGITSSAIASSVKLNRIGTNGLYMDNEGKELAFEPTVPGGGAAGLVPQLSLVATLRGPNERSRAGKGRMFVPPTTGVGSGLDTHGNVPGSVAKNHAYGITSLLAILNDVYLTAGVPAVAGIASAVGAGAFQGVAKVTVGRVVDTMRSRRNKDTEKPEEVEL